MILRSISQFKVGLRQALVNHIIGAFTIQQNLIVSLENYRHPLSYIVKIQNVQQFVFLAATFDLDGNGSRCSVFENKAEISSRRNQSRFIRTLRLIFQSK